MKNFLKKYWLIIVLILVFMKKTTQTILTPVTDSFKIRGVDGWGSGAYGASRGKRTHKGVDVVVSLGQKIKSPINGKISRHPFPYEHDVSYKGIEIIGSGDDHMWKIKMFYVENQIPRGTSVVRGMAVATAQDIAKKYNTEKKVMTNHVHVEVYKDGVLVDPTELFTTAKPV